MRLINVNTYHLEEFFGVNIPPYAILSHCWGEGEVSFQDFNGTTWQMKLGGTKIEYACNQARIEALPYLWVDTCCIDKSSSSELSEAINSMYQWYAKSRICYAYLEDVDGRPAGPHNIDKGDFAHSRWFTRGWTLQELIAPAQVEFFGLGWSHFGGRRELSDTISTITKIPYDILISAHNMNMLSVAKRMSWASKRQTTRIEDMAYCLLGIFGVNMPLLYGEGDRAFQRLQEELIKETNDQTIFGWHSNQPQPHYGVFARSPANFHGIRDLVPIPNIAETPYSMTNRGLHIQAPLISLSEYLFFAILECHVALDYSGRLGIPLLNTTNPTIFIRDSSSVPVIFTHKEVREAELRTIYILKSPMDLNRAIYQYPCWLQAKSILPHGYGLHAVSPSRYPFNWSTTTMGLLLDPGDNSLSFRRQLHAAFEFTISIPLSRPIIIPPEGSHLGSLVVAVTVNAEWHGDEISTASANVFTKPSDMSLEHWLKRYETGEFIPREDGCEVASTKAGRNGFKVKVGVDTRRETIFDQNIFVIEVQC